MKLLLLLSDEAQIASQRDRALAEAASEAAKARQEVGEVIDELLERATPSTRPWNGFP